MARAVLAVCAAALLCAGSSTAARTETPTTQSITIQMSDHTLLHCGLTLPTVTQRPGGWPGVLLFSGLGQTHPTMDAIAVAEFAPRGLASLACDERGTGASPGNFDLAGPTDVHDVHDLFVWFAARPDISNTWIGAFGVSVGGAEVWNAAVAGVPFMAIVPAETWTSLGAALAPHGVVKSPLFDAITALGPPVGWNSASGLAARSSRAKLHTASVPPRFMVQGSHDFLFDIGQVRSAFGLIRGKTILEIGPTAKALPRIADWLFASLLNAPKPPPSKASRVTVAGRTFTGLPATRRASVNLPGASTLTPTGFASRKVRLTGGPFTTFGGGSVTVRYSGAVDWDHLVATVSLAGSHAALTEGAAPIGGAAGVVKIPLLDVAATVPRGKAIVVTLGATSADGVFGEPVPVGASIRLTRVTCTLSFLGR